jgi:malonyl-CoA/methylmalonyl-CoA synthetase
MAEIEYTMRDSSSSLLLHHRNFNSSVPSLPSLKSVEVPVFKPNGKSGLEEPVQLKAQYLSAGALLIYTSGTTGQALFTLGHAHRFTHTSTGKPKGALMNHRTVQSQIDCLVKAWRWSSIDHILHVLPLHHTHVKHFSMRLSSI